MQYPAATLSDLASMLLSNLTASHATCSILLSLNVKVIPDAKDHSSFYPTQSRAASCPAPVPYPNGEELEVKALPLLIGAFVQAANVEAGENPEKKRKGELHFLASVFANITAVCGFIVGPWPSFR